MFHRLRQWRALPPRERSLLLLLALLQPTISISLRLRGYRRTLAWLERRSVCPASHPASAHELANAQRLAELAAIAGRHGPMATTCLRQALAVHMLLRQRCLQPELKLGVDRLGATADMHAWVELEGIPLAQPGLRHRGFQAAASASTASTTASNAS